MGRVGRGAANGVNGRILQNVLLIESKCSREHFEVIERRGFATTNSTNADNSTDKKTWI